MLTVPFNSVRKPAYFYGFHSPFLASALLLLQKYYRLQFITNECHDSIHRGHCESYRTNQKKKKKCSSQHASKWRFFFCWFLRLLFCAVVQGFLWIPLIWTRNGNFLFNIDEAALNKTNHQAIFRINCHLGLTSGIYKVLWGAYGN